MAERILPFYPVRKKDFEETETYGGFLNANRANSFDSVYTEACEYLETQKIKPTSGFLTAEVLDSDSIISQFKNILLQPFEESCREVEATHGEMAGSMANVYEQLSHLLDNKFQEFSESVQTVGALQPIKTIDFPVMAKAHVTQCYKQIVDEEISPSIVVKKRIWHTFAYDANDPSKQWEYPQCLYNDEFIEMMEAGKGVQLDSNAQPLPLYNFNIVEELTDVTTQHLYRPVIDLSIDKVEVADGTVITLIHPMTVNMADGMWIGGKLDLKYQDAAGEEKELHDIMTGYMDWVTNTTTLNSANQTDGVTKVYFRGRLSNERNEHTIRIRYAEEDREWKIGEKLKVDSGYSLETLSEHKVMLNMDLYQKTYNDLQRLISDASDSDGFLFLDSQFEKYENVNLDPLQWNPLVMKTEFNCDSTIATVALQSQYINEMLKFKLDRFLIDIADTLKQQGLSFVIWGNPRYISLLQPYVKWVVKDGSSFGGVQLDYGYGYMTSGEIKVHVVSSMKMNAMKERQRGLRIIPIINKENSMTFKRYKFSTDIRTSKDSGYKDPQTPGGTEVYIWGSERYEDVPMQAVQGHVAFENDGFITFLKPRVSVPPSTTP